MKAARLAVTVLAVMLLVNVSSDAQESITDVVQKVKPAVVTVITYDKDGKEDGFGTGFFVTDSHIITNYHVIEGAARAEVKSATGKVYKVKGVAGSDEIADVARLVLEQPVKDAPVLTLSKSVPKEGERIVVVGSPLGLELTVTDGIVSAVRDIPGMGKFIQLTAAISPGSSGSPVVNLKGEVVGVARASMVDGQSLNFATASKQVLSLKREATEQLGEKGAPRVSRQGLELCDKAAAYLMAGEYVKAIEAYKEAIRLEPKGAFGAYLHGGLGMAYREVERYTESIDSYKQAIQLAPKEALYHSGLAVTYFGLDRYTDAINALKQAVILEPNEMLHHFGLGNAYAALERFKEATDEFKEAVRLDPKDVNCHYLLGDAYLGLGRYTEAVAAFKETVRIDPDYAIAHYNLGVAYEELGRYPEAIAAYKEAIRIDPEDAEAHLNLGVAYGKLGRYTEALASYKQAIRIDPDDADAHCNLGLIYNILGRHTEAIMSCKEAIRIDTDDVRAHISLGFAYVRTGNKSAALDQYRILKDLDAEMAKKLFDLIYP